MRFVRTYLVCEHCQTRLRGQVACSTSQKLTMPILICPKCGHRGQPGDGFILGPQVMHDRLRDEVRALLPVEVDVDADRDHHAETERPLAIRGKMRTQTVRETITEDEAVTNTENETEMD